jgi:hypothetical protein
MIAAHSFRILMVVIALFAVMPARPANACVGLGCGCTVSVQTVAFGQYNPIGGAAKDTTGDVGVTCGGLVVGLFFRMTSVSARAGAPRLQTGA